MYYKWERHRWILYIVLHTDKARLLFIKCSRLNDYYYQWYYQWPYTYVFLQFL
jgi:hypothetical protein